MAYRFWSERKQAKSLDGPQECGLLQARRRLELIERLLMKPTPQGIRDAGLVLDEANQLLNQYCRSGSGQPAGPGELSLQELRPMISEFKQICIRVKVLLEGAQKVQWNRMRAIGAITQSYTATARIKSWKPQSGTINLHL